MAQVIRLRAEEDMTLGEIWSLIESWTDWLAARDIAPSVQEQYVSAFVTTLRRCRSTPRSMDRDQFNKYLGSMSARGATRETIIRANRSFYGWALRRGLVSQDPTDEAKTRPPKHGPADYMTQEEAKAIIEASKRRRNPRAPWVMTLLFETGARVGSIAGLEERDIPRPYVGEPITFRVVKFDKPYQVRLTPAAAEACRELLRMYKGHGTLVGVDKRRISEWFHMAAVDSGQPPGRRHAHLARHSFATALWSRSGGDALLVKEALNHADISLIHRYAGLAPNAQSAALSESLFTLLPEDIIESPPPRD